VQDAKASSVAGGAVDRWCRWFFGPLVAAAALVGLGACGETNVPGDDPATDFLRRLDAGRPGAAAAIAARRFDEEGRHTIWWRAHQAVALVEHGDWEAAIAAFVHVEFTDSAVLRDRVIRLRRIEALLEARAHLRAREEMVALRRDYPFCRLGAEESELDLALEARLREPIDAGTLNWYRAELLRRRGDAPAVALEYAREGLLITEHVEVASEVLAHWRLDIASLLVELGASRRALEHLALVPPGTREGRGAMFQAFALWQAGAHEEARTRARWAAERSADPEVKKRANALLHRLRAARSPHYKEP